MQDAITKALENISTHGDTDIFPFPFERQMFQDGLQHCAAFLSSLDDQFDQNLADFPPLTIEMLSQVGYTGFRKATLVEPFWNAYYLALVISVADSIEAKRVPRERKHVFSYRYEWNSQRKSLFAPVTWNDYRRESMLQSKHHSYVLQTDIADFYPRVNHHRLENALKRLGTDTKFPTRILKLLSIFSETASYGLPIGGPASRLLAELALNDCDQHLTSRNISFCRYADDYSIFCNTKAEAYSLLVMLSNKLANDGLSLQRQKTRILTSEEFANMNKLLDPDSEPSSSDEQRLLSISIRYDPYSPTAEDDYETLKGALGQIDIVGILSREVGKAAIDQPVAKQAIDALKVLEPETQEQALLILLDRDNLTTLLPVFPSIMRAVRGIYLGLSEKGQARIDAALVNIYDNDDFLFAVELNASYFIQALALRYTVDKERLLLSLFERFSTNHYLRRQIILAMSKWHRHYWLTDVKKVFKTSTEWERRAMIVGSYRLGDEGEHWRKNNRHLWSNAEQMVRDWAAWRSQNHTLDGIA